MKKIINELIQLQELTIARQQQEASQTDPHLKGLDKNIAAMLKALPDDVAEQYAKLQKRDVLAIVPLNEQVCGACGMSLPVSFAQSVHQAEKLHQCPSCARYLYHTDRVVRQTVEKAKRYDAPKSGIERFSGKTLMIPNLEASTAEEALQICADKLASEGFIEDSTFLVEEALRREAIASTAVDHGLAFPHVRGVEGGGLSMVVASSANGIDFGNLDGEKTHLIFFITIPSAASAFYLKLLAGLTQTFRKDAARDKLLKADKADKMWKAMIQLTRKTIL
jgi:mannitol/fructose-specific phosphotransferase system IIA component (Ntr-type)